MKCNKCGKEIPNTQQKQPASEVICFSCLDAPSGQENRLLAAAWRILPMRLADESTAVLDNAHWEVKHGSGDLLTTIKAVRKKYRLETQVPPNIPSSATPQAGLEPRKRNGGEQ